MEILYSKQAQKFLFKQNKKTADRIRQGIEELADQNIIKDIRPMEGRHKKEGDMRLRIGTFRVIYNYGVNGELQVLLVLKIDNRGDVYK